MRTRITNASGQTSTLRPRIGFFADPHDAAHLRVRPSAGDWEYAEYETADYHVVCPSLSPDTAYTTSVRVGSDGHWGEWSEPWEFRTPSEPVLRIVSPCHAGRALGPDVRIVCEVESRSPVERVSASLDGQPVTLAQDPSGAFGAHVSLAHGLHDLKVETAAGSSRVWAESQFWVWCSQKEKGELLVLDLTEVASWPVAENPDAALRMYDLLHAAACLQGLANRARPRVLLRVFPQDDDWLAYLRRPGAWLEKAAIRTVSSPETPEQALAETLSAFRDIVRGLVVWDAEVPATSNVATTAAGVEDLIPVRADSAISKALHAHGLRVKLDLTGMFTGAGEIPGTAYASTGSAKCDAYLWAKARYLDSGKADPRVLGYWLDSFWLTNPGRMPWWEHCLTNHDWIVRNRGFLFDLSNWGDEPPQDDPRQKTGTDLETFKAVLLSAYEQAGGEMIHVSGFTPWAFKYTTHAEAPGVHEPVDTEWEVVRVLSAYNAYLDADAHGISAMANASLWAQMPLSDCYVQTPPPTREHLQSLGYLDSDGRLAPLAFTLFYIGDFDSAAWLYRRVKDLWAEESRGALPMAWAFNPNLCARMAPALHFAFAEMSDRDWLTAGDSGAGYVNPTMLLEPRPISGLPSGKDAWVRHCRDLYARFNYRITGFLINGHAGPLTAEAEAMTAEFSPDGSATQAMWVSRENHLSGPMPMALQHHDLCPDIEANIACMQRFRQPGVPQFLNFRLILLGSDLVQALMGEIKRRSPGDAWQEVDPYAFYYLLRHSLGGSNERRATFTFDTLPAKAAAGQEYDVAIGVRNDGWETWRPGSEWLECGFGPSVNWQAASRADLPSPVAPGDSVVLHLSLTAPQIPNAFVFYYDMASDQGGFRASGNPWREKRLGMDSRI